MIHVFKTTIRTLETLKEVKSAALNLATEFYEDPDETKYTVYTEAEHDFHPCGQTCVKVTVTYVDSPKTGSANTELKYKKSYLVDYEDGIPHLH